MAASATQGGHKEKETRNVADAQRDGRPAEYRWRPLRKCRNSIRCTTPQSLADAHCWSANIGEGKTWMKVNFAPGKIPSGAWAQKMNM